MKNITILLFFIVFGTNTNFAQNYNQSEIIRDYLQNLVQQGDLTESDIADYAISNNYVSKHNQVQHIKLTQKFEGVLVFNSMISLNISNEGEIIHAVNGFYSNLQDLIVSKDIYLNAKDALNITADYFDITSFEPELLRSENDKQFFGGSNLSRVEIPTELYYAPNSAGELVLCWDLSVLLHNSPNHWSLRIDAASAEINDVLNWTLTCNHNEMAFDSPQIKHEKGCFDNVKVNQRFSNSGGDYQYNVIPWPSESPSYADRVMVENPHYTNASPYGWHDIDGIEGAEFNSTRGNNVWAFTDRNGDSSADFDLVSADFVFDYAFDDESLEPVDYQEAALTNLFYSSNMFHDFTYQYGFDEASGNFQTKNLTGQGNDQDEVLAHGQYGIEAATPSINNSSFGTPPDGGNPGMYMYLWDRSAVPQQLLKVTAPAEIEGGYESLAANFGAAVTTEPVSGEVVFVDDGIFPVTNACESLVNGEDLVGKIAMIDRGECQFGTKVLRAEEAGAIAVIVCNNQSTGVISMGGGNDGGSVTIPSIFISQSDCEQIRIYVGDGMEVSIYADQDQQGPERLDGSFDHGVVTHEYGHGVSNRLVGGPNNTSCLQNDITQVDGTTYREGEQMGEGWSDFFFLVTGVKSTDDKNTARGLASYVLRQGPDGRGLRSFPFSHDMTVCPLTYYDIKNTSVPHGVGTVWAAVLWDLYWDFVAEYGFDEDQFQGTGGNNMAIQLVMDGMKFLNCNPGFIDGRDAILAADMANNNGDNQKLIWNTFARRGLGYSASQGTNWKVSDGIEAFDIPDEYTDKIVISQHVTPYIEPGEEIEVSVFVSNHKEANVTNMEVTCDIPEGTAYIDGSASMEATVNGNQLVFNIAEMSVSEILEITYKLSSDPAYFSIQMEYDDMEQDADVRWYPDNEVGDDLFEYTDDSGQADSKGWTVNNTTLENDQTLLSLNQFDILGDQPVLRFDHSFATEAGVDAGLIEVSKDGGLSWEVLHDKAFRGVPPIKVEYSSFALVDLAAFSGNSNGFITSYFDLSDYKGEKLFFRYRFHSNEDIFLQQFLNGWNIDNFEIIDMTNFEGQICITTAEGDSECEMVNERGTIVANGEVSGVKPNEELKDLFSLFPNPASHKLHLQLSATIQPGSIVQVISLDGKTVYNETLDGQILKNHVLDIQNIPAGPYIVQIISGNDIEIEKFVKQ